MKAQDKTQRHRKFKRSWGIWYAFDNATGNSVSLKTRVRAEADQMVNAIERIFVVREVMKGMAFFAANFCALPGVGDATANTSASAQRFSESV